jgi:hypothetical protein
MQFLSSGYRKSQNQIAVSEKIEDVARQEVDTSAWSCQNTEVGPWYDKVDYCGFLPEAV